MERRHVPTVHGRSRAAVALATTLILALAGTPTIAPVGGTSGATAAARAAPAAPLPVECPARRGTDDDRTGAIRRADALLRDRYQLGDHPEVRLARDLDWDENPLRDANWLVRFQGLSWVRSLLTAWTETHDRRYAARAVEIVHDWLADNPRGGPQHAYAWYDQVTGIRAGVVACTGALLGMTPAMRAGLAVHGALLASSAYYVGVGNHALDQDLGLMDAAWALGRRDWLARARDRVARLVVRSVSPAGVTNEQAVGYQRYNYDRYVAARERLRAYGSSVPAGFARVDRMPVFLAWATAPDGTYETIGDTNRDRAEAIPGTIAEYAATRGASGPRPAATLRLYRQDGWLFARTGWGRDRPIGDEVAWSLRFGPPPYIHGHADGGALTLWGDGARQLVDPGKFTYTPGAWHDWFAGRDAHNVVIGDGLPTRGTPTRLVAWRADAARIDVTVASEPAPGVTLRRRVLFSRAAGWLLVEDRVSSASSRTWRQRWHLPEDAAPVVAGRSVTTHRAGGDLLLRSLLPATVRIVRGGRGPIEGWVSWRYNDRVTAPVAELVRHGTSARWLTLLVTGPETPEARIDDLAIDADGYRLTIATRGHVETVVVTADGSRVAPVEGPTS